MKQYILHVLCEGQTEDDFCAHVLKPYLRQYGIVVKSQILVTNRKRNLCGGLLSYEQAKNDLILMRRQFVDTNSVEHWFTTMFDLYALPNEFPGMDVNIVDKYGKVEHVEMAIAKNLQVAHLIPYIELHEFEALVFAAYQRFPLLFSDLEGRLGIIEKVLKSYQGNPELINSSRDTSPSHRIAQFLSSKGHAYNKPKVGWTITQYEGIDNLRRKCAHFNLWLEKLIGITAAS